MDDQERYQRARARVRELKGFYSHLMSYLLVNGGLLFINAVTSPGHWWFYWVTIFWGIGLIAHAVQVFGAGGFFGRDWEERKIREIIDKEGQK